MLDVIGKLYHKVIQEQVQRAYDTGYDAGITRGFKLGKEAKASQAYDILEEAEQIIEDREG